MPHVLIRKNDTGEIRDHPVAEWDGLCEFDWFDNNNSCDCNRSLHFERAGGNQPDFGSRSECGDSAYSVRVTDDAGNEIAVDDDWPKPTTT